MHKTITSCRLLICVASLLMSMGCYSQSQQQWRDSLSVLSKKIEQNVYNTDVHLKKAAVNLQLAEWEYAIVEYNLVLSHEEKNIAALYYRAFANMQLRRYEASKNDYLDVLKQTPFNMEARLGLVQAYLKLKRKTDAVDEMNRLVELFPDSAVTYATRASYERDMKLYEVSLIDWDEAIKRDKSNTDYVISKVDVLICLNQKSRAKSLLDDLYKRGVNGGLLRDWYIKCR